MSQPPPSFPPCDQVQDVPLYDFLGGGAAIEAAVEIFYRKILLDPRVSSFFDDVDMNAQAAKQRAFLTFALGGPMSYRGRDLRHAHRDMALTDEHFNAIVEHLESTLAELGVPPALRGRVTALVETTRADVLNR